MSPEQMEAARNLLYHYGKPGGWRPNRFTTCLIRTFEAADHHNRNKLLVTFPAFIPAIHILITEGATKLQETVEYQESQKP